MSRSHDDQMASRLLREPVRPMPEALRGRLLAIPSGAAEAESPETGTEIDRLYYVALSAGNTLSTGRDASLDPEALGTTPIRAAIVRLLAAVFRDARLVRPMPQHLANGLRAVHRTARPAWRTRWITEPRWAAAACWLLAFALTLGTGDAVAGLLDAPTKLHETSTSWASGWTHTASDQARSAWTSTRGSLVAGYDLVRSRAVAFGVHAEAWGGRAASDVEAGWTYMTRSFAPTYETNPGESSPEEARDDR